MSSMKIAKLVSVLVERTEARTVSWEPTAWSHKFICSLSGYAVGVGSTNGIVTLTIEDEYDEVIEQVTDSELLSVGAGAAAQLRSLFIIARRNAKGADKAIDDILGALK